MKIIFKILKYIFYSFIVLIGIIIISLYLTGNEYVLKAVPMVYFRGKTTASIDDYPDFESHTIQNGKIQEWIKHDNYNKIPLTPALNQELKSTHSAAFVVIHQGKLFHETYWEPYASSSKVNSFSMAKTITALLTEKAVEDGYIKSLDEPITQYLPEFKDDALAKKCSVRDLITMTSGYDWKEDYYLPINPTAKAYYGDNMDEVILTRSFITEPGTKWQYLSGTTQLMGYVLRRAIKQPIANYLSQKFWVPMGMQESGVWTLDHKDGIEKTYCCIYSTAKDFAKLGQLMLNKGKWNGQQLIDSTYIKTATTPINLSNGHYGYSLWMDYRYKTPFYFFRGHLGQYIICVPSKDLVIVRLGEGVDTSPYQYSDGYFPNDIYIYLDEVINMIE